MAPCSSMQLERLRTRWPDVAWDRVPWEAHLQTHAGEHQEDLCLAAACLAADPAALAALDLLIRRVADDDELRQLVRVRLLLGEEPRLKSYAGRGQLTSWLRLVARRTELDHDRARAQEITLSAANEAVAQASAAPEMALVRAASRRVLVAAVERGLGALPERDRTLLVAQFFEGATHESLAKRLGAPRSTITAWLVEARTKLAEAVRAELATQGFDEQELHSLVRALAADRSR